MLYHYTDRLSLSEIVRDGAIRATSMTLHVDALATDRGIDTPPIVWLTSNPIVDGVIVCKMTTGGWSTTLVGDLCRIALPDDYPCLGLAEYVAARSMEPKSWDWVVRTGAMAGSDYTTWRLCDRDIPASDWVAVERLAEIRPGGLTVWAPYRTESGR